MTVIGFPTPGQDDDGLAASIARHPAGKRRALGAVTYRWAVRCVWADLDGKGEHTDVVSRDDEQQARTMADFWNTRADGPTCTVLRQQVITTTGPWAEVPS